MRVEWISGRSGPWLCDKYQIPARTLSGRQNREGWTRKALAEQIDPPPIELAGDAIAQNEAPAHEIGETLPPGLLGPREAARRALDEAVRLACAGKMGLAIEAARVADLLARTALRLEAGGMGEDEDAPSDEEILAAVRARVMTLAAETQARRMAGGEAARGETEG